MDKKHSPKRVLCIFSVYLRFLSKTRTRRVLDICKEFRTIILLPKGLYVEEQIQQNAEAIWRVPVLKGANVGCKIYNLFIITLYTLSCVVRNPGIDIIYTPPNLVILAGYMASKLFSKKWIVDLYDSPIPIVYPKGVAGFIYKQGVRLYKSLVNTADLVSVAIMPDAINWLKAKNVVHVTNGTDTSMYGKAAIPAPPGGKLTMAFLETSIVMSGIEYLFSAISMLVREGIVNMELVLIGFVDENGRMAALIDEHGVGDHVRYLGTMPSEDLPEKLQSVQIGVNPLPSGPHRDETYPIKIFEYMAAGLAIVSSDLRGTASVIKNNQTGLLVPPDNAEAFAHGLRKVITDREYREMLAQNAKQAALQYDWAGINRRIIERMKDLC